MRLSSPRTPQCARRAAALGVLGALSTCGLALATLSAGPSALTSHRRLTAPSKSGFTITVGPRTRTALPGTKATYVVRTVQRGRRRSVRMRIVSRLPAGVRSAIVRSRRTGSPRRLLLRTSAAARPGTYRIRLRASRRPARVGGRTSAERWKSVTRTFRLVIAALDARLTVGGDATLTLAPGRTSPVDVRVGNPGTRPVRVGSLAVSIAGIVAPRAGEGRTCSLADFAVSPYDGASFVLPARAELHLRDLGVPPSQWPQLTMLKRQANQDGCRGATLRLSLSATGGQIR